MSVVPCLWFESEAAEAAEFYVSLLPGSRITSGLEGPPGQPVMSVAFELQGSPFIALNGRRPGQPGFSDALSLQIEADTQDEIDRLWDALTADGGAPGRCGWLVDRFGVSWQVTPARLVELLQVPDRYAGARVMQAMLGMDRIVIAELEAAAAG